jgi:hypothetical protein
MLMSSSFILVRCFVYVNVLYCFCLFVLGLFVCLFVACLMLTFTGVLAVFTSKLFFVYLTFCLHGYYLFPFSSFAQCISSVKCVIILQF